jgi:hypothetical protein
MNYIPTNYVKIKTYVIMELVHHIIVVGRENDVKWKILARSMGRVNVVVVVFGIGLVL